MIGTSSNQSSIFLIEGLANIQFVVTKPGNSDAVDINTESVEDILKEVSKN